MVMSDSESGQDDLFIAQVPAIGPSLTGRTCNWALIHREEVGNSAVYFMCI